MPGKAPCVFTRKKMAVKRGSRDNGMGFSVRTPIMTKEPQVLLDSCEEHIEGLPVGMVYRGGQTGMRRSTRHHVGEGYAAILLKQL